MRSWQQGLPGLSVICLSFLSIGVLGDDAEVSTQAEFLQALGTSSVTVIRLLGDIYLSSNMVVPGAEPAAVYVLTRNLTITVPLGREAPMDPYPIMDTSAVLTPRLRVPAGVTLTFRHLLIAHTGPQGSLQPGGMWPYLPLVNDPGSYGMAERVDCYYLAAACPSFNLVLPIVGSLTRPPSMLGKNTLQSLPAGACVPASSKLVIDRCFKYALLMVDVGLASGAYASLPFNPKHSVYESSFQNVTLLCSQQISDTCIKQYGLLNCTVILAAKLSPPPSPPLAPSPPSPAPPPLTSSTSSSAVVGAAVGGAVGGTVLLALAAAAAIFLYRQAARRRPAGSLDKPSHISSTQSASVLIQLDGSAAKADRSKAGGGSKEQSQLQGGDSKSTLGVASQPALLASRDLPWCDEALEIFEELGRGGFGVVYRGQWKGLAVAAKMMIVHEDRHEQARRQMMEATMSTGLSHPNIVTTYIFDMKRLADDGDPATEARLRRNPLLVKTWQLTILQELCLGGSLRTIMMGRMRMLNAPNAEALMAHVLQISLDVALGLEHLHSKNVVHMDLTPDNVLLQATGPSARPSGLRWIAKVADFGLSMAFEDGRSHASQVFVGTPHYIAPETQGSGIVGKQSDIFTLGVLMHELVHATGLATPFVGSTSPATWSSVESFDFSYGSQTCFEPARSGGDTGAVQDASSLRPRPNLGMLLLAAGKAPARPSRPALSGVLAGGTLLAGGTTLMGGTPAGGTSCVSGSLGGRTAATTASAADGTPGGTIPLQAGGPPHPSVNPQLTNQGGDASTASDLSDHTCSSSAFHPPPSFTSNYNSASGGQDAPYHDVVRGPAVLRCADEQLSSQPGSDPVLEGEQQASAALDQRPPIFAAPLGGRNPLPPAPDASSEAPLGGGAPLQSPPDGGCATSATVVVGTFNKQTLAKEPIHATDPASPTVPTNGNNPITPTHATQDIGPVERVYATGASYNPSDATANHSDLSELTYPTEHLYPTYPANPTYSADTTNHTNPSDQSEMISPTMDHTNLSGRSELTYPTDPPADAAAQGPPPAPSPPLMGGGRGRGGAAAALPPLPPTCSPAHQQLIADCLSQSPQGRPKIGDVRARLAALLQQALALGPEARQG